MKTWSQSWWPRWRMKRRKMDVVQDAVNQLTPEDAAVLCRRLVRMEHANKLIVIMLAKRGMASTNAGEGRSMEMYADALEHGRRIKFAVFPMRVLEFVPTELEQEVEDIFKEYENNEQN